MPYDMASLMAALGLGGGTGAGMQFGANGMQGAGGMQGGGMQGWMGPQGGTPQGGMPGGGQMPQLQGGAPSSPAAGGQGLLSSGMMGPLSAAASMLQASGPSRTPVGFGQVAGAGLQGMMGGMQADQQNAMLQQQQANLGRIADKIGQPPATGAAPAPGAMGTMPTPQAGPPQGAPQMPQLPQGMMPGATPTQMPQGTPGAMPSVGMPPQQQMQALAQNPYLQMMMRKQQGFA